MTVETEAFLEDVEAGRVIIRNVVLCHLQSGGTFALGVSGKIQRLSKKKLQFGGAMISINNDMQKVVLYGSSPIYVQYICYIIICPTHKPLLVLSPYT